MRVSDRGSPISSQLVNGFSKRLHDKRCANRQQAQVNGAEKRVAVQLAVDKPADDDRQEHTGQREEK